MFRYKFTEGDTWRAKNQAKAHDSDLTPRTMGNLGEIAFHQFCRSYLPVAYWNWNTGEDIRRGQTEYKPYDFEVFNQTVDVKARSSMTEFSPGKFFADSRQDPEDINADIVVMVWLREAESPDEFEEAMIFGWVETNQFIEEHRSGYGFEGQPGEFEYTPNNALTSLFPEVAHLADESVSEFQLLADDREFELGELVVDREGDDDDELLVVEQVDDHAHSVLVDGETAVAEWEGNQTYDSTDLVVGVTYEIEKYRNVQSYKLTSEIIEAGNDPYYFPVSRLSKNRNFCLILGIR